MGHVSRQPLQHLAEDEHVRLSEPLRIEVEPTHLSSTLGHLHRRKRQQRSAKSFEISLWPSGTKKEGVTLGDVEGVILEVGTCDVEVRRDSFTAIILKHPFRDNCNPVSAFPRLQNYN